uniref:Uncharacterized protein n=1 Tax=Panagrolaimus superbus TaxID=310955 RepID=A0A914YCG1_9BILA
MASDTSEKKYAAFIHCDNLENDIIVTAIDLKTLKQIRSYFEVIPAKDVKKFINDIPSKFGDFKSIILSLFGFQSKDFKNNFEFRNAVRAKLQLTNARYQFIKIGTMLLSVPLYASGINLNVSENVVTATLINSNFEILNFEFTGNGYLLSDTQSIPYDENDNVKNIREKLCSKYNPKELIINADMDDRKKFEKMNNAHFVTCSCYVLTEFTAKLMADYSKWMLDKSSVKTLMVPLIDNQYVFSKFLGDKQHDEGLVANDKQILPFAKTLLLPKSKCAYAVVCQDRYVQKPVILLVIQNTNGNIAVMDVSTFPEPSVERINQNEKYHGIKFTLEIDINNFPTFTFRPMILKGIKILPQTLDDKKLKTKVPVIGFFGNLSVICVSKNGGNYEFLKDWGG